MPKKKKRRVIDRSKAEYRRPRYSAEEIAIGKLLADEAADDKAKDAAIAAALKTREFAAARDRQDARIVTEPVEIQEWGCGVRHNGISVDGRL